MPLQIGPVQVIGFGPMQSTSGHGFNIMDSRGHRWITLTFQTIAEADAAREKIQAATTGVINAYVGDN